MTIQPNSMFSTAEAARHPTTQYVLSVGMMSLWFQALRARVHGFVKIAGPIPGEIKDISMFPIMTLHV